MPDLDTFSPFVFDINTMNRQVHSLRNIFSKYFRASKTPTGACRSKRLRLPGCKGVSYNRPTLEVRSLRRRVEPVVDFLTLCEKAAQAGAQTLVDWIGRFQVQEKGPADLVTEADSASQEAIRRVLMAAVPDHGFVGEEGAEPVNAEAEYCWVADPLDGIKEAPECNGGLEGSI